MQPAEAHSSGPAAFAALKAEIAAGLADRNRSFVFPSQAVADAWAAAALELPGVDAVESGRFIGWDRFKERCFSVEKDERPSDSLARTIWAAGIVAAQGRNPFLRRILGASGRPDAAGRRGAGGGGSAPSPAFVPFLAKIPPSLKRIKTTVDKLGGLSACHDEETIADLLALYTNYELFLKKHHLFEPGWQDLDSRVSGAASYLVVAPELIEDFEQYRAEVEKLGPAVSLFKLERLKKDEPPQLRRFPNAYEEIRYTFLKIGGLLDSGLRPDDIAVTIPALDQAAPYVERAAREAGVPVVLRQGRPLSSSAFGRLLSEIRETVSCNFSFETLRALLLDSFAPWKDPASARGLVRLGIDKHAYASYREDGRLVDIWEESFKTDPSSSAGARIFYNRLRPVLESIAGASDFESLRTHIYEFRGKFFDESGWNEDQLRFVQRAMEELSGLARAEEELGARGTLTSPFSLYLKALENSSYVPQHKGAAVPVYPYRVSALLPVRRHFVLGASQDGIKVSYSSFPFLSDSQKETLGIMESDASDSFACAYFYGGADFSYAEQDWLSYAMPHPFFIKDGDPLPAPDFAELREKATARAEAAAWRGEKPLPEKMPLFIKNAFCAALPSLSPAARFGKALPARPEACSALMARPNMRDSSRPDLLSVSYSTIDDYLKCHFYWLLSRCLGVQNEAMGIGAGEDNAFFDNRLKGIIAHAALMELLSRMGKLGSFCAENTDRYKAMIEPSIEAVLPAQIEEQGPFLRPMFAAYRPILVDRFGRLVDELAENSSGWDAGSLEKKFELAGPGYLLIGTIDRLGSRETENGREYCIIDYKKKKVPVQSEFMLNTDRKTEAAKSAGPQAESTAEAPDSDSAGAPEDAKPEAENDLKLYQIAAYVRLAEASGIRVSSASFWSIENAKQTDVFTPQGAGKAGTTRASYDAELARFDDALGRCVDGIKSGRYEPLESSDAILGKCGNCSFKCVCRMHYAAK